MSVVIASLVPAFTATRATSWVPSRCVGRAQTTSGCRSASASPFVQYLHLWGPVCATEAVLRRIIKEGCGPPRLVALHNQAYRQCSICAKRGSDGRRSALSLKALGAELLCASEVCEPRDAPGTPDAHRIITGVHKHP